jgi:hypothetical protein
VHLRRRHAHTNTNHLYDHQASSTSAGERDPRMAAVRRFDAGGLLLRSRPGASGLLPGPSSH